jgi:hypothetical protein
LYLLSSSAQYQRLVADLGADAPSPDLDVVRCAYLED